MFLKKPANDLSLFTYESDNRRASYRLRLTGDEVVTFILDEKEHMAIDIGAGGLSFENKGFIKGDGGPITLNLPGHDHPIPAILKIRSICKYNVCHSQFVEMAEEDVEKIHQYLLERQKNRVRAKKSTHK